ncbi:MAG: aminotransferase class I/II-fold pyridoxal phosphate-dependent enzyme, partial [Bacteroidales bacterium]|nr:aminotransferase class I/II-fold pyridoxal phosphate-dependent enzyme [Bacteroidales bacterium]
PNITKYADDYIILISSSKIFSYAGQRIGMLVMSDHLYNREYPDLLRYYNSPKFGHSLVFGALYALSSGVAHSAQYGLAALFKAVNDGQYRYRDEVSEYGKKAEILKKLFTDNGFMIVYDTDIDEPIADGFYFTVSYPGMTGSELLTELLYYGISMISLKISDSTRTEGLRACVSQVPRSQFGDIEVRLRQFGKDHQVKN